jgi:hypothetical protein
MTNTSGSQAIQYGDVEEVKRPLGQSIKRGLLCRCPACGSGKLFRSLPEAGGQLCRLRRRDASSPLGRPPALHHHRHCRPHHHRRLHDDRPGLADAALADLHDLDAADAAGHTAIIQPIKGGVIGLQWALKMHGFGGHSGEQDQYEIPGRRR